MFYNKLVINLSGIAFFRHNGPKQYWLAVSCFYVIDQKYMMQSIISPHWVTVVMKKFFIKGEKNSIQRGPQNQQSVTSCQNRSLLLTSSCILRARKESTTPLHIWGLRVSCKLLTSSFICPLFTNVLFISSFRTRSHLKSLGKMLYNYKQRKKQTHKQHIESKNCFLYFVIMFVVSLITTSIQNYFCFCLHSLLHFPLTMMS